eukprot:XP_003731112.1 PREDICTED: uncharacterized protein LOC100891603 [Strongylocentrotus purpuratus]
MEKEIKEVYQESQSNSVRLTKIRSVTIFSTVVLTSLVLGGCILGAVWIAQDGFNQCTGEDVSPGEEAGIFDRDMTKDTRLVMGDGRIMTEHFEYIQASNTLLIHTPPSNFSGYSRATVALDYDRSLVFVNIHDENICIAFPWPAEMANNLKKFMTEEGDQNEGEVLDVVARELTDMNFVNVGEIPAGFLQGSSGTTVGALCAGRPSYWLEDNAVASRQRRLARAREIDIIIICWPECCILIIIATE